MVLPKAFEICARKVSRFLPLTKAFRDVSIMHSLCKVSAIRIFEHHGTVSYPELLERVLSCGPRPVPRLLSFQLRVITRRISSQSTYCEAVLRSALSISILQIQWYKDTHYDKRINLTYRITAEHFPQVRIAKWHMLIVRFKDCKKTSTPGQGWARLGCKLEMCLMAEFRG